MANIEIKDGEYTKTIYSMIKEQRYDKFINRYSVNGFVSNFKNLPHAACMNDFNF